MNSLRPFSGSPRQTRILLSIKPQYADAIVRGTKKYEFRRTIFSRQIDIVLLYASAPVQRVVAEFDVLSIISEPLTTLWKETERYAGLDKASFFRYFKGHDVGHAIKIGKVRKYSVPFCPIQQLGLMPPQSFSYLKPVNGMPKVALNCQGAKKAQK